MAECEEHAVQLNVVTVSAVELRNFTTTVEKFECQGYGSRQGLFKMKIKQSDREKGTSLSELLKLLKCYVQSACVYQEFRRYPKCQDVYGYRAIPAALGTRPLEPYLNRMFSCSSYTSHETCCSNILKNCNGPTYADLMQHYFDVLQSCSIMRSSGRSTINDDKIESLIQTGSKVRREYDEVVSRISSSASKDVTSPMLTKEICDNCNCDDCFSEDEEGTCNAEESGPHIEGSGHPFIENYPKYAAGIQLKNNTVKVVEGFGLSDIYSVLNLLPNLHKGLHLPYFYVGEEHSSFPAHVEHSFLLSANFMHYGSPKAWISIQPQFHGKVCELVRQQIMELAHTSCFNSLAHKFYFPTLSFLEKHNLPYTITLQHPGEFVILYPKTIHFGFNLGPNINESVNFGTRSWIPEGLIASKWRCRCFGDSQIHIDVKPLLAAFYPEELKILFERDSESKCCSDVEKTKAKKVKIFKCVGCEASFIDHRKRLIHHINIRHPAQASSFLTEVEKIYPSKSVSSNRGVVCGACGVVVIGNMAHLERHVIAQSKNPASNEDAREKHSNLLATLQSTIRRRKRKMDP